jgi:hypothetical protein
MVEKILMKPVSSIFSRLRKWRAAGNRSRCCRTHRHTDQESVLVRQLVEFVVGILAHARGIAPDGCSTNNNGAPGLPWNIFDESSLAASDRTNVARRFTMVGGDGGGTSANAALIIQERSLVSAMISRLRFTPATITRQAICPPFDSVCIARPPSTIVIAFR